LLEESSSIEYQAKGISDNLVFLKRKPFALQKAKRSFLLAGCEAGCFSLSRLLQPKQELESSAYPFCCKGHQISDFKSMQALDPARDTRLLWETRLVVAIAKEARVCPCKRRR